MTVKNEQFRKAAAPGLAWLLGRGPGESRRGIHLKNSPLADSHAAGRRFSRNRYPSSTYRGVFATEAYQAPLRGVPRSSEACLDRWMTGPLSRSRSSIRWRRRRGGAADLRLAGAQALAELLIRGDVPGCEVTDAADHGAGAPLMGNSDRVLDPARESSSCRDPEDGGQPCPGDFSRGAVPARRDETQNATGRFSPPTSGGAAKSLLDAAQFRRVSDETGTCIDATS